MCHPAPLGQPRFDPVFGANSWFGPGEMPDWMETESAGLPRLERKSIPFDTDYARTYFRSLGKPIEVQMCRGCFSNRTTYAHLTGQNTSAHASGQVIFQGDAQPMVLHAGLQGRPQTKWEIVRARRRCSILLPTACSNQRFLRTLRRVPPGRRICGRSLHLIP